MEKKEIESKSLQENIYIIINTYKKNNNNRVKSLSNVKNLKLRYDSINWANSFIKLNRLADKMLNYKELLSFEDFLELYELFKITDIIHNPRNRVTDRVSYLNELNAHIKYLNERITKKIVPIQNTPQKIVPMPNIPQKIETENSEQPLDRIISYFPLFDKKTIAPKEKQKLPKCSISITDDIESQKILQKIEKLEEKIVFILEMYQEEIPYEMTKMVLKYTNNEKNKDIYHTKKNLIECCMNDVQTIYEEIIDLYIKIVSYIGNKYESPVLISDLKSILLLFNEIYDIVYPLDFSIKNNDIFDIQVNTNLSEKKKNRLGNKVCNMLFHDTEEHKNKKSNKLT